MIIAPETCDDGNLGDNNGCEVTCLINLASWDCISTPNPPSIWPISICSPVCGDGLLVTGEACDDYDLISGNGCDSNCSLESGWTCLGAPSICVANCGDG